jgi:CRP-like cAMP-binding protein
VYNIDAWEDTDLLVVTKADFWARLGAIRAVNEMVRKLDQNYAVASQKRMTATISLPAEQRYSQLQNEYPEFLQRFPQHTIASYLGITKETLSRVRRQVANK